MKYICCLILIFFGTHSWAQGTFSSRNLHRDSLYSSLDQNKQIFYHFKSQSNKPMPLVIQLHSWSFSADSLKTLGLDSIVISKNYNYIFPDFRGINNTAKACGSDYVVADIDEAIDWALANLNVDKSKIYLVGYSGGGFATMVMYMKSRHKIKAFSAWVGISDLWAWYGESLQRRNRYAGDLLKCVDTTEPDSTKLLARSPLHMKAPKKIRKKSSFHLYAGIHDGHGRSMPVPISQTIKMYNTLVEDRGEKDRKNYMDEAIMQKMVASQSFPENFAMSQIADKKAIRLKSGRISLCVFEGGHDMLSEVVLAEIEK